MEILKIKSIKVYSSTRNGKSLPSDEYAYGSNIGYYIYADGRLVITENQNTLAIYAPGIWNQLYIKYE